MHLVAQEHRTRSDNDLAAMVEALAEQSMYDAMLHMHETVQVTINIDEIIDWLEDTSRDQLRFQYGERFDHNSEFKRPHIGNPCIKVLILVIRLNRSLK